MEALLLTAAAQQASGAPEQALAAALAAGRRAAALQLDGAATEAAVAAAAAWLALGASTPSALPLHSCKDDASQAVCEFRVRCGWRTGHTASVAHFCAAVRQQPHLSSRMERSGNPAEACIAETVRLRFCS